MYEMAKPYEGDHNNTSTQLNGPVEQRTCTDLFCCILFVLIVGAVVGIFVYGVVQGKTSDLLGLYDQNGVMCSKTEFPYAYMPGLPTNSSNITVVCVSACPSASTSLTVNCLTSNTLCTTSTYTGLYNSTLIAKVYCSPDDSLVTNVQQQTQSQITQSVDDTRNSYLVLIGAVVLALVLGIFYFIFLRCCAGVMIWLSIVIFILCSIAIGVYMFLFTQGIQIVKIPFDLSTANKDSMRIASYVLWGAAVLAIILTIVLYKTIKLAIGVIKCTAIYVADTCHIVFYPLFVGIFLICTIAMFIIGLIFVGSMGTQKPTDGSPFALIVPDTLQSVLLALYAFSGIWIIFYLNGQTNFVLSSAATIWYFSNSSTGQTPHRPVLTSITRGWRYHPGTIAFGSLLLGLFFIIRMLSAIFKANPNNATNNKCINCCVSCVTCFGSIFNICMRFLTKGAWVQVALNGTNYCASSLAAFKLIAGNPIRIAISTGLSSLVTLLGKLGITFIVMVGAYYVMVTMQEFVILIKNPVIPTVLCGLIAYAVSSLYMSVYGVSCNAIIQCFLMDELDAKNRGQRARYCPEPLREIIDDNTYVD